MKLLAKAQIPQLLDEIAAFVEQIAPAGAVNGLAQLLLKLTAPGVPDIYQGTDFWDFTLVDPDNRALAGAIRSTKAAISSNNCVICASARSFIRKLLRRPLVRLVGCRPIASQLCLAQGLLLPRRQALGECTSPADVLSVEIERPGANDHLQQHGNVACRGRIARSKWRTALYPARQQTRPFVRLLAQNGEPRAHILAALVVVCCGRQ
jgi:hypothetical protein